MVYGGPRRPGPQIRRGDIPGHGPATVMVATMKSQPRHLEPFRRLTAACCRTLGSARDAEDAPGRRSYWPGPHATVARSGPGRDLGAQRSPPTSASTYWRPGAGAPCRWGSHRFPTLTTGRPPVSLLSGHVDPRRPGYGRSRSVWSRPPAWARPKGTVSRASIRPAIGYAPGPVTPSDATTSTRSWRSCTWTPSSPCRRSGTGSRGLPPSDSGQGRPGTAAGFGPDGGHSQAQPRSPPGILVQGGRT